MERQYNSAMNTRNTSSMNLHYSQQLTFSLQKLSVSVQFFLGTGRQVKSHL